MKEIKCPICGTVMNVSLHGHASCSGEVEPGIRCEVYIEAGSVDQVISIIKKRNEMVKRIWDHLAEEVTEEPRNRHGRFA